MTRDELLALKDQARQAFYGADSPMVTRAVCGFCGGRPVGNAATWVDGKPRPPAPCPRCGETHYPNDERQVV